MKQKSDKKPSATLERFEELVRNPGKPQPRLPRMNCFLLFVLVFLVVVGLTAGYYLSVEKKAPRFDIPAGRITLSDPEGILLEEDETAIRALIDEISGLAGCDVAVMFFDGQHSNVVNVYDVIASEWAPEKGVLLVGDLRKNVMQFGLLGTGWRLAGWDPGKVRSEFVKFGENRKGAKTILLLKQLKKSIETASKIPEKPESEAGTASAPETEQQEKRNSSAMTEEEIEAEIMAQDQAATEKIEAEDRAAEAELDGDDGDESGEGTASGILFSSPGVEAGDEASVKKTALTMLGLSVLVALAFFFLGRKQRATKLKRNPEVLEEFKRKHAKKSCLRLIDLNEYDPDKWTHGKPLRIAAILLGIVFGFHVAVSGVSGPVKKDVPLEVGSLIPERQEGVRIVDNAGVFPEEGRAKVAAAIAHLEAQTGGEMMVFTLPTINGMSIEEFGIATASYWAVGKKGQDNGVVFILVVDDHRNRIEIGDGWEGFVNDARAGDLLREIVPDLRAEQYAEGTVKVVQGIERYVTGASVSGEDGTVSGAAVKAIAPEVKDYGTLTCAKPPCDPRKLDPDAPMWGMLGVFGCLICIALAYWGRVVATSVPHLYIYDPTAVRSYSSSGSGGGSSSSSYSGGSSSSSSSGGGSFSGGGASGSW